MTARHYTAGACVTGYLKLGGQVVMRRIAAHAAALLLCQKTGWAMPTLPTHHLRPCYGRMGICTVYTC